jgi:FkbM family methyltransferase
MERVKGAWWGLVTKHRDRQMVRALDAWAAVHPTALIVQIGANDGHGTDPLTTLVDTHPGWRVVFVEPVEEHFAALKARRGNDVARFTLVRAAVTDHDGDVTMTTVEATADMPPWVRGISSIREDTVLSHAADVTGLETAIREVTVPAMTLPSLLERTDSADLDLLFLDTEGHDAVILDQLDRLARWPPAVLFEHKHLAPADLDRCINRFEGAGYRVRVFTSDVLATTR